MTVLKWKKYIDSTDAEHITPDDVIDNNYKIEQSIDYQIKKAKELGVDTFYISFHWQYDPVVSGMMGYHNKSGLYVPADCNNLTSVAHMACPTPHFNQMVYKYNAGNLQCLWFIPNHREFWRILKNEQEVAPEIKRWVQQAYSGELFTFVDKENNENTVGKQVKILDPATIA